MDLHATTDKLQLARSSAANIDSVINWLEYVKATGAVAGIGSERTAFASAATGDMLAAPGASNGKKMTSGTWRNKHASLACDITVILDQNATDFEIHKETLQPGEMLEYIEGIGFFRMAAASSGFGDLLVRYGLGMAGQNIATVQPWFPSNGAVALEGGTTYKFEGWLYMTRAAGATSHTTGMGFGGTATLTAIRAQYNCGEGDVATLADDDVIMATSASNLQVKAASTSTTEVMKAKVIGAVEINAAGTFIPQFTYSAAPGGAPTIAAEFKLIKLGAGFASKGTWT